MTLKDYRRKKFRTAEEFAAALGTTVTRVRGWECGATIPTQYLRPVAKVLGIGINALLDAVEADKK